MKYVNMFFGTLWRNRLVVAIFIGAYFLFLFVLFPFNDLSNFITSAVAEGTRNQVYVQADQMNVHFLPQPAISAENLTVDIASPPGSRQLGPLEAKWAKVTPGLFSVLFNLPALLKAQAGGLPPEVLAKLSGHIRAEGIWNGDADLSVGSGKKGESGAARSRVSLMLDKINLQQVRQWADLPVPLSGTGSVAAEFLIAPQMEDQPEGDFEMNMSAVKMSTWTDINSGLVLPELKLTDVSAKGRLVGGSLIVEELRFGKSQDPLSGRIKGNMAINFRQQNGMTQALPGQYNFTVELDMNPTVQKALGTFLAVMITPDKKADGSTHYLFRASGQSFAVIPNLTRVSSF
ncbi:MAG: type II secretion system protein GspN [Bdellovibrionales bacterium]